MLNAKILNGHARKSMRENAMIDRVNLEKCSKILTAFITKGIQPTVINNNGQAFSYKEPEDTEKNREKGLINTWPVSVASNGVTIPWEFFAKEIRDNWNYLQFDPISDDIKLVLIKQPSIVEIQKECLYVA